MGFLFFTLTYYTKILACRRNYCYHNAALQTKMRRLIIALLDCLTFAEKGIE